MDWFQCKYDDICLDIPVLKYRDFTIALSIPNGGIVAVSIWNWDKSIVETLDTEDYDKYSDKKWHIFHAKYRINKILMEKPSRKYSFLEQFHIDKLRFILKSHNIKCHDKRFGRLIIKAIDNHGLSIQQIWETLKQYPEPKTELNDLPLFKNN